MLTEMLPFTLNLDATAIAGASLWSLALYLAFSGIGDWIIQQLQRWFNFAERSLYINRAEFEKTRIARESQNAFYASLFSIVPFLIFGSLCNYGIELSLGRSWAISMGILACVSCGVYELGRRDGREQ
ncbi:hypothetical protein H6G17_10895 [Chroococcidiopsis sp. FACHB-1243]|uniref:hypothetical protein n=1 Tax=Chroococcidiopsis sp. [FACHB-1243] TaxID=2692781 RepID=UPI001783FF7D|nr:hypothetical protein [Chroococcidiopsis sp. [FACHB-1243]]MBD2306019.1 hypothetical protein [Chroococcidiopsis sp. [FACHB-1243]]